MDIAETIEAANTSRKEWESEFSYGQDYAEGAAKNDLLMVLDGYFPAEQQQIAEYLRRNPKAVRTLAETAAIHEYDARALRVALDSVSQGGEGHDDMLAPRDNTRTYPAFCEGFAQRYVKDVFAGLKALTGNGTPEE